MGCGASTAAPVPLAAQNRPGDAATGSAQAGQAHEHHHHHKKKKDIVTSCSIVLEAYFKPMAADGSEYDSDAHLNVPLANYLEYAFPRAKVDYEFKRLKTPDFRVRVKSLNGQAVNAYVIDEDAPANVVAYDRNFVFAVGHVLRNLARRGTNWTPDITPSTLLRLFADTVKMCLLNADTAATGAAPLHRVTAPFVPASSGTVSTSKGSKLSVSGVGVGVGSKPAPSPASGARPSPSPTASVGNGGDGGESGDAVIRDPAAKRRALQERRERESRAAAAEKATPKGRLLALLAAAGYEIEDRGDKFLSQLQRALELLQDAVFCYAFGPGAVPGPLLSPASYPVGPAAGDAPEAATAAPARNIGLPVLPPAGSAAPPPLTVAGPARVLVTSANALPAAMRAKIVYPPGVTYLPPAPAATPGGAKRAAPKPTPSPLAAAAATPTAAATATGDGDAADTASASSSAGAGAGAAPASAAATVAAAAAAAAAAPEPVTPGWWYATGCRARPPSSVSGRDLLAWYLMFLVCISGHLPVATLQQALYGGRAVQTVATPRIFRFLVTGSATRVGAAAPAGLAAGLGLGGDDDLPSLRLSGAKLSALASTSPLVATQSEPARAAIKAAANRAQQLQQSLGGRAGTSGGIGAEAFRAFWAELLSHADVSLWTEHALAETLGLGPREGWMAVMAHWSWVAFHHSQWAFEQLDADASGAVEEHDYAPLIEAQAYAGVKEVKAVATDYFNHDRIKPYLGSRLLHVDLPERTLQSDMFHFFFAINCLGRAENSLTVARDLLFLFDTPGYLATIAPTLHAPRARRVTALFQRFLAPGKHSLVPSEVPNQIVPAATLIAETEKNILERKRAFVLGVQQRAGTADEEDSKAALAALKVDKSDRSERGELNVSQEDFTKAMKRSGVLEESGRGIERYWYLMLHKYYC